MEKEKMTQIFGTMADIALTRLEKHKAAESIPGEDVIQFVSATLQIYNFIADNHQPELFPQ